MNITKVKNGFIITVNDSGVSGMFGGKKEEHVFQTFEAMSKWMKEYYSK
jgi:hypothetical protein